MIVQIISNIGWCTNPPNSGVLIFAREFEASVANVANTTYKIYITKKRIKVKKITRSSWKLTIPSITGEYGV
jgi:hypothetical protein